MEAKVVEVAEAVAVEVVVTVEELEEAAAAVVTVEVVAEVAVVVVEAETGGISAIGIMPLMNGMRCPMMKDRVSSLCEMSEQEAQATAIVMCPQQLPHPQLKHPQPLRRLTVTIPL
jgi:hypothetical protein